MECEEKLRLETLYRDSAVRFCATVDELQTARATFNRVAYSDLLKLSEEARQKCQLARIALQGHIADHGC